MRAIAVIPARLASTRLPRKMLREIGGRPLVGVVYQAVRSSPLLDDVVIATDSDDILRVCRRHGWKAQITSAAHSSGTQRVHEVSNSIAADIYLNVQGDEPLARPEHIATLLDVMRDSNVCVGTLKTTSAAADVSNPNAVKVVTDAIGQRSEEHTSELQSQSNLVCRLLLEKKKKINTRQTIVPTTSSISDDIRTILSSSAHMRTSIPLILRFLIN